NNNYLHNFRIECDCQTVGFLHLQNTANRSLAKINIANRLLYCASKSDIIKWLMQIAVSLDLQFSNISNFDLARDSATDYYDQYCKVYFQSNFCAAQIHTVHESSPRYSAFRKKLNIFHEVDSRN